jgi:DNA-binding NtrC family response regulator
MLEAVAPLDPDPRTDRGLGEIIGTAPMMKDLYQQIQLVAPTDVTVLVEGETGTGKDLIAHTLHSLSRRKGASFVAFNASNLQEQLFESELFGHVKGSFSGAHEHHEGLARAADGGTLFIDEVGELPLANQAKLLRFLDTKEIRAVGSTRAVRVDVRILCATNRDLQVEVRRGSFREDLYYRLRVITLRVPPLRERMEDLPLLVSHFLHRFAGQYSKEIPGISDDTWEALLSHPWRGNVRELENEMERVAVMTPTGRPITTALLSSEVRSAPSPMDLSPGVGLREFRHGVEKRIMVEALERTAWNVTAAARELGISRVGLTKKMKRLGVERPDRRPRAQSLY